MENDYNQYNGDDQINNFNESVEPISFNEQPYPDTPPVPMVSFGGLPPAIEAVKSAGKSAAFLIATICYTLCTIVSLLYSVTMGLGMGVLTSAMPLTGVDAATQEIYQATYISTFITTLVLAACPLILLLVGMWVIYGSSKNNTATVKGLGACRAAIIIWDILMWIATVFTVIIAVFLIAVSGMLGEMVSEMVYTDVTDIVSGVIIGVAVGFLVFVILALIYVTKMLKTTRVVKDIVTVGFSKKKVSVYLIVINFIIAFGGVFTLLLTAGLSAVAAYLPEILSGMGMGGMDMTMITTELESITGVMVISAVPQVLGIIGIICINIVLIKLRKKLKAIFVY